MCVECWMACLSPKKELNQPTAKSPATALMTIVTAMTVPSREGEAPYIFLYTRGRAVVYIETPQAVINLMLNGSHALRSTCM